MAASKNLTPSQKLSAITETSCLVNIMNEILVNCWQNKIPSIAICPTQDLEQTLGYDVALPYFQKVIGLQFKAYSRRNYKALDYFKIYNSQHITLSAYPRNTAFYVFPDYKTHDQMHSDRHAELRGQYYKILNNTWFVEVHSIPLGTRRIYRNQLVTGAIPSLRWQILTVKTNRCELGFRIQKTNETSELLDPEEKLIETLQIPSGVFCFFYTELPHAEINGQEKVKLT